MQLKILLMMYLNRVSLAHKNIKYLLYFYNYKKMSISLLFLPFKIWLFLS